MHNIRTPPDWAAYDFRMPQIAAFLNVPSRTLDGWLATARAQGHEPGVTAGRFRWLSSYHVYAAALLTKLHRVGHPVTPQAIFGAFDFASSAPQPGACWKVTDTDGARVIVDAWLAFVAVRGWAEREAMKND
jgi:hypothetical protein